MSRDFATRRTDEGVAGRRRWRRRRRRIVDLFQDQQLALANETSVGVRRVVHTASRTLATIFPVRRHRRIVVSLQLLLRLLLRGVIYERRQSGAASMAVPVSRIVGSRSEAARALHRRRRFRPQHLIRIVVYADAVDEISGGGSGGVFDDDADVIERGIEGAARGRSRRIVMGRLLLLLLTMIVISGIFQNAFTQGFAVSGRRRRRPGRGSGNRFRFSRRRRPQRLVALSLRRQEFAYHGSGGVGAFGFGRLKALHVLEEGGLVVRGGASRRRTSRERRRSRSQRVGRRRTRRFHLKGERGRKDEGGERREKPRREEI